MPNDLSAEFRNVIEGIEIVTGKLETCLAAPNGPRNDDFERKITRARWCRPSNWLLFNHYSTAAFGNRFNVETSQL
jgi:hypothetical protein